MLPVDDIRAWLWANPGIHDVTAHSLGRAYRQFYSLDFPVNEHAFGWLPVHKEHIFVQIFRQKPVATGAVFLLHGYLDHTGIQGPTIRRLLALGYDVVGIDHVGHGFSTGDRASTDSFQLYVDSLTAAARTADSGDKPVVMAHSLGGAVAMTHMLQQPGVFRRAVLIAPLYRPRSWRLLSAAHLFGRHFIKGQPRLWRQNTRDLAYRHFIRNVDPLSPRFIPIAWINAMMRWIREFRALHPSTAEVLVVQGTDDSTVDVAGNWRVIQDKFPNAAQHIVQDGKHQLLNELDEWQDKVWAPIEPFLVPTREVA